MSQLGKLLYKFYYRQRNQKKIIEKYGGIDNYSLMVEGEKKMRDYAFKNLTQRFPFTRDGVYKLYFLTGDKFIHQTLFCVYSFFKHLSAEEAIKFSVTFFDDGSLEEATIKFLRESYPNIEVILFTQAQDEIEKNLPKERYPSIHKCLAGLVLFKKLFYVHSNKKPGLKIFLDSDMLFIKRPEAFLNWLSSDSDSNDRCFAIEDVSMNYGYSDALINKISSTVTTVAINSGFYGVSTEAIDFNYLENTLKEILAGEGIHYYLEQFITGVVLTKKLEKLTILPKSDYIVMPAAQQVDSQQGILHHYVNVSKEWYFKSGWQQAVKVG